MKISLDELLTVRSVVEQELSELMRDMSMGAMRQTVNDIETEHIPVEQFEATVEKVAKTQKYHSHLTDLLAKANQTLLTYEMDGKENTVTIAQAIEHAKWLRRLAGTHRQLANKKAVNVQSGYSNEQTVTKALHDIDGYKKSTKALEKEANIISRAVTRISTQTMLDVDGAEEYL